MNSLLSDKEYDHLYFAFAALQYQFDVLSKDSKLDTYNTRMSHKEQRLR